MLPCLNLALSDVMANISQLEWQTGIKEIAIVHMAGRRTGIVVESNNYIINVDDPMSFN